MGDGEWRKEGGQGSRQELTPPLFCFVYERSPWSVFQGLFVSKQYSREGRI